MQPVQFWKLPSIRISAWNSSSLPRCTSPARAMDGCEDVNMVLHATNAVEVALRVPVARVPNVGGGAVWLWAGRLEFPQTLPLPCVAHERRCGARAADARRRSARHRCSLRGINSGQGGGQGLTTRTRSWRRRSVAKGRGARKTRVVLPSRLRVSLTRTASGFQPLRAVAVSAMTWMSGVSGAWV